MTILETIDLLKYVSDLISANKQTEDVHKHNCLYVMGDFMSDNEIQGIFPSQPCNKKSQPISSYKL